MKIRASHHSDYDQRVLDDCDAKIPESERERFAATLPTIPGRYVFDNNYAEPWVLKDNGQWYDASGETRPTRYNYILGIMMKNPTRIGD